MPAAVAFCFFISGAAALILQVLWTRMLGHVFGATSLAVSTTLSVFMAGLALGSHLAGQRCRTLRRPLLVFAMLEAGVGLYGLGVPWLLDVLPSVQAHWLPADLGFWGYALARWGVVAIALLGPTTAMGATLPILCEGVVRRSHRVARDAGGLYAANTFGAVAGAMTAGFVLIPTFGMRTTVYAAAALDLAVAVIVVGLFARRSAPGTDSEHRIPARRASDVEGARAVSAVDRRRTLVVFALSGAAAMALEVLWTRAVGVVIGASTYSFTLILTTFLIGLAFGAAMMARFVDRLRDPVGMLGVVQVAVGVSAILCGRLVDQLPRLLHEVARSPAVTNDRLYAANFVLAALVMLPATVGLGTVFPLVIRILTPRGVRHVGPVVGRAYALNTVGAIAGSFAAGFVVLPWVGVERGLAVCSAVSLALGVWLVLERARVRRAVIAAAVAGLVVIFAAPTWDVRAWTSGLFRMYLARSVYADGWSPHGRVLYHRDGVASTVTVEQQDDGVGVSLKVNGKVDASDIGDMPTQVLSGLLPILLHPDPSRVLVIGYGSGVTPGSALKAPIERLDVAEIEARVYEAANGHFGHVNERPDRDPRARLFVDDGRNFLRRQRNPYDVIISEPSNPWMTGAASLFTQEFFRIARRKLQPDGLFLQWLQLYELSEKNVQVVLRTFASVFDHLLVFTPDPSSNDLLLVGSMSPIVVDRALVERRMAEAGIRAALEKGSFVAPEDLMGLLLADRRRLASFIDRGPVNTDDNAMIEFSAPKDLLTYATVDAEHRFAFVLDGRRIELLGSVFVGFGPPWARFADRLLWSGRVEDADVFMQRAEAAGERGVSRLRRLRAYVSEADNEPVVVADAVTKGDPDYAQAAIAMFERREADAMAIVDGAADFASRSPAHQMLHAFLCYRNDRYDEAESGFAALTEDTAFVTRYPSVLYYAARVAMHRGTYREGFALLERFDRVKQKGPAAPTQRIQAKR